MKLVDHFEANQENTSANLNSTLSNLKPYFKGISLESLIKFIEACLAYRKNFLVFELYDTIVTNITQYKY